MKFDYDLKNYSFSLLFFVAVLNVCGIFVINSASNMSEAIVNRQIIGTLAGICIALILSFVDYHIYVRHYRFFYLLVTGILVLVLIMGATHKGAGRWIVVPLLGQLQPAEFVKAGLIVFFGGYFERHRDSLNSPGIFFLTLVLFAVPAALIFIEPNLSTTIIIFVIFAAMYFAAGLSFKWIFAAAAVSVPVVLTVLYTFTTDLYERLPLIRDYQKDRILGFLYPERYSDTFLQQQNSIIAIASGGVLGKGLYNTDIGSVKTGNFLIEEDTDFIFAIIGEELGFRGSILIFAGFLIIVLLSLRIAGTSKDVAGRVIPVGFAVWIAFQTFTNVAVATGLFPNTGVTLPFFSRGVSSLLAIYICLGVVLNISLQMKKG